MKIIITGVSGFVGKNIVPLLECSGVELLLVGRNPHNIQKLFPMHRAVSYDDLKNETQKFDSIVHLAVLNNNSSKSLNEFRKINVHFLESLIEVAKTLEIRTFINLTTIHTIKSGNLSHYALTKMEGEQVLSKAKGITVINLRLPAIYGTTYAGKLSILLKFPKFVRPFVFQILTSIKPAVKAKLVVKALIEASNGNIKSDLILTDRQLDNKFYNITKRVLDLTFVFFTLTLLWWLLILVWLLVKLSSPGPGIFAQKRVGKNAELFTCYKFRTMKLNTKIVGTHEVNPSNITSVGKFLRKTKIDELPQLLNILKNEMSLVGPRPCLPSQTDLISARRSLGVFEVVGGITGWAQIKNIDMRDPYRLSEIDAEYQSLRTIPLDLKIILATAFGRGQGDKIK